MDIVRRVQDILLKPRDTWPVIEAERTDTGRLYTGYLMILAAIPAIAMFIGMSLIGVGAFGLSVRTPLLWGLSSMVVNYVLTLVMLYVVAIIVEALAPTFGGTKDRLQALKLVAYGSTASFVGGIFYLVPALSILSLLAALYSIYLFYLGLPVLMKCSKDKALGYTLVVGVITLVAGFVVGALAAAVTPGPSFGLGASAGSSEVTLNTPDGKVSVNTDGLQAAARQMEVAAAQVTAATAGTVAGAAAATGSALSPQQFKAFLPETVGGMPRESVEAVGDGQALVSVATATYRQGERSVNLSITDVGSGLGAAAAMWSMVTVDREADGEVEKIYRDGARSVHEKHRKDGSEAEVQVVLANGTMVGVEGQGMDLAGVKSVMAAMDLNRLEALPRPAAKQ